MFAGNVSRLALALALAFAAPALAQPAKPLAAKPLTERIAHTDPARFRTAKAVHDGAGEMQFGVVLGADALDTNFLFLHRGVIPPGAGIGQHFHNDCEEMFVILDGEAQFTIDGRTAVLKGPAGAPDQAGHAHGIYNASDRPVQWMNINVGMAKVYDAFNLGDPRVGVAIDPIPQFMTLRLDRGLLKEQANFRGGRGAVLYRQALGPSVFRTAWSYVDHLVIPPGAEVGPDAQAEMSEVYYVLGGEGVITVGGQSATVRGGDAVPVRLGETKSFKTTGTQPLELMVIGVARDLDAKKRFIAATMPARR
jgi:mannose-6-phosphate isomerase-like protein (cupin superfamily)